LATNGLGPRAPVLPLAATFWYCSLAMINLALIYEME